MNPANTNARGQQQQAALPVVPFVSAAHEHIEQVFDETVTPGSNQLQMGPFDVPAYGYLRHILIEVEGVGGDLDGGAVSPDFPFNVFSAVELQDVNGAPIYGPIDGYGTFVANLLGGYAGRSDPRAQGQYSASFAAPKFLMRIPIEISHRDGFGSLANQNTSSAYKINLTLNTLANLMTGGTAPVAPTLRIRAWLEAWSLPDEADLRGRPQQQTPPMLGTGMYHSNFRKDVQSGSNTVILPRVGNLIRFLAIIARTSAGVRSDTVFADPTELYWDARTMRRESQSVNLERLESAIPDIVDRPDGLFAYLFDTSTKNTVGDDSPQLWYPTVQSTRLQIDGTTQAAGTWQIITCDIAPVEVNPLERYDQRSATGFNPNAGAAPNGNG